MIPTAVKLRRLAPMILGFIGLGLGQILLARGTTPELLGEFSLLFAWIHFASIVALSGYHFSVTKALAPLRTSESGSAIRFIVAQSGKAVAIQSLALVAISTVFLLLNPNRLPSATVQYALWALPLVPLLALAQLRFAIVTALGRHWRAQVPDNMLRPVLLGGVLLTMPYFGSIATPLGLVLISIGAYAFAGALGAVLMFGVLPKPNAAHFDAATVRADLRGVARYSGATNLVIAMLKSLELMIVGLLVPSIELAAYIVVTRLAEMLNIVYFLIDPIYSQKFARFVAENQQDALAQATRSYSWYATLWALASLTIFAFFGHWLLGLFGHQYAAYWPILLVIALGQLMNAITGAGAQVLTLGGHERIALISTSVCALAYLLVLGVVTFKFGILGATLCFVAYQLCRGLYQAYLVKRRTNINVTAFSLANQ